MCIASFILSIFGVLLLPGVLSIVFGIIGLKQVGENRQKGKVFAIVGIILSVIGMVVLLV